MIRDPKRPKRPKRPSKWHIDMAVDNWLDARPDIKALHYFTVDPTGQVVELLGRTYGGKLELGESPLYGYFLNGEEVTPDYVAPKRPVR